MFGSKLVAAVAVVWLVGGCFALALAAEEESIELSLGLTIESKSLPIWATADAGDVRQLSEHARKLRQGVLLVGTARNGHGTAFVISRKHRLLATNAHVADLFAKAGQMLAVLNEDTTVYEVERVWYHPGVLRVLDEKSQVIGRTTDPNDGNLFSRSADVAVVQLKSTGPDLPVELPLALPERISDPFAAPIAILGFPGHDTREWPGLGERPQATLHDGVISRTTDFLLDNVETPEQRQFLQHTAVGFGGFSGSPVLLADGCVVGIHNSFRPVSDRGGQAVMSHAIRIDCVWELIGYHKLTDMFPLPIELAALNLHRFDHPDPNVEKYRRVRELTTEAERLNHLHKFAEASAVASQALAIVRSHPEALYQKLNSHGAYAATYQKSLPSKTRLEQHQLAAAYAKKLVQAAPSDPKSMLATLATMANTAVEKFHCGEKEAAIRDQQLVRAAANRLLESGKLSGNENVALAYHVRSIANMNLVINRGGSDVAEALFDNGEALRLRPNNIPLMQTRAIIFNSAKRHREAAVWERRVKEQQAQLRAAP